MRADDLLATISAVAASPLAAWVAAGALLVLLATLAWSTLRLRRQLRDLRAIVSGQWNDLGELRRTAQSLTDAHAASATRLTAIGAELEALTKQQEQLMLLSADTGPYVQAIRHAQRGAGVAELMSTHGLGEAEAELIVALHTRSRSE